MASQQAWATLGPSSFSGDFPDPSVVAEGSTYYAFATQYGYWDATQRRFVCGPNDADPSDPNPCRNIQRLSGPGPNGPWTVRSDGLEQMPSWADQGYTWAPSVLKIAGQWLMYYTTRQHSTGQQCISVATAPTLTQTFVDRSSGPLVCQNSRGGSIDPAPFIDANGSIYLYWKSTDKVWFSTYAAIWGQQLSTSGLTAIGSAQRLLVRDQAWEGSTIEGPFMVGVPPVSTTTSRYTKYDLFYSGNSWETAKYAVGYAECTGPLTGCTKVTKSGPWYSANVAGTGPNGPGGQGFFTDSAGQLQMAYHAWAGEVGYGGPPPGGRRAMWVNPVRYNSTTHRPVPPS